MNYVYILFSQKTKKYYVGYTNNVVDRLSRHNRGANRSTKSGRPWKVVYYEEFETKTEAWLREYKIKSYKGGEAFKALLKLK